MYSEAGPERTSIHRNLGPAPLTFYSRSLPLARLPAGTTGSMASASESVDNLNQILGSQDNDAKKAAEAAKTMAVGAVAAAAIATKVRHRHRGISPHTTLSLPRL